MSLKRNTVWNLLGVGLPLAVAVLAIPVLMRGLGLERFGVLALLWALIGYLGLFEFGLGRTMTVKLAKLGVNSPASPALVRCGLTLGLAAGIAGAALTAALAPWLVGSWLRVPANLQSDALQAFLIASIGVIATTGMGVARGVLEGQLRFAQSNALRVVTGVSGFALPWISLHAFGPSLSAIATLMVIGRVACWLAAFALLWQAMRQKPAPGWWSQWRELLGFGGWLTVSAIVGPIMVYGDRFFLGASLSLADVSRYSVVQEMLQRLLVFPNAFTSAWLPALASHNAADRRAQYRAGLPKYTAAMLLICVVAAMMVEPVISIWLGDSVAQQVKNMAWVLCAGIFFNAMGQLPFTLLHASGQVRATALFHIIQLPLYLGGVFWLTQHWGLVGAALAWTLRAAVDWLGLHWLVQRQQAASK